jgi:transposase InsO family protein
VPHFFERAAPHALWQVDLLEEEKTACGTVHGVFYLDDHSRYAVAGAFFHDKREEHVLTVGIQAVQTHGLPLEVLSDNGAQFRPVGEELRAQGAQTRYEQGWAALGVMVTFAGPYHPQTKGKEERFNRFVKEDFLDEVRDQVSSLADLNARFGTWLQWYNLAHAHSTLGFQPPQSRYRPGLAVDPATLWRAFAREESRKVRLDGKIQVGNRLYQLPSGWERSHVRVYQLGGQLRVVGGKENRLLGTWPL